MEFPQKIIELSNHIYDHEGVEGLSMSYKYILPYLDEIKSIDLIQFYLYNIINYGYKYNMGLFASTIDLYQDKKIEFWEELLMKELGSKKHNQVSENFFEKIENYPVSIFVYKFLGINFFELDFESLIEKKLLKKHIDFFILNFSVLQRDYEFFENFEDGFWKDLKEFTALSEKLVLNKSSKFKAIYNLEEFEKYVTKKLETNF